MMFFLITWGEFMRVIMGVLALTLSTVSLAASTQHSALHKDETAVKKQVKKALTAITTNKTSVLQKSLHRQAKELHNPLGILFYQPNYVMPFYYTGSTDQAVYQGHTPDNQKVKSEEFKFQISFQVPLWHNMFRIDHRPVSLNMSYTQLSYWQFYAKSQYFRETNYEPQVFLASNFYKNWLGRIGVDHQSNGRGGSTERSWNRVFADVVFSRNHWIFSIEPWMLIFKSESSDLHNPQIADYLGHEQFVIAYQFNNKAEASILIRNVEHLTTRMTEIASFSYPVSKHINLYLQVFHGYGQSLIEYNHKTTSAGIGIALSNWI